MRVLMVLNQTTRDIRVLVKLRDPRIREEVVSLLEGNRAKEAFGMLLNRAEVEGYFPEGARLDVKPDVTLFEDMCH